MTRILPRENPFRSERIDNMAYRLNDLTWDDILLKLEMLRYKASIIGPKGSGKTTFLRDLVPNLEHRGFSIHSVRLNTEKRRIPCLSWLHHFMRPHLNTILLVDGAEQLGSMQKVFLRALSSLPTGLVVTSHQPCFLPCLLECSTHVDLMDEIITELAGDNSENAITVGRHCFHKHHGNIREVLRDLYDLSASGQL